MKLVVVALALLAIVSAAPAAEEPIPIVKQESEVNFDGSYHSAYETGNGISAQEDGQLKNAGNADAEAEEVKGSFQYTAPDGTPIAISYVADENGFQPSGDHIPTAPPIPAAIARALEWIAQHPEPEEAAPGRKL